MNIFASTFRITNHYIMKKTFLLLAFIGTLISCSTDDDKDLDSTCNVSDPTEELVWLKEEIDNVKEDEYSYYAMATFEGETVFYYGNCNPAVNYISSVRNCSGDNLGDINDFFDELTDITIVWKHMDTQCDF